MSVCEPCWSRASQDALLCGGSTVEHYQRHLREADERGEMHWTVNLVGPATTEEQQ